MSIIQDFKISRLKIQFKLADPPPLGDTLPGASEHGSGAFRTATVALNGTFVYNSLFFEPEQKRRRPATLERKTFA